MVLGFLASPGQSSGAASTNSIQLVAFRSRDRRGTRNIYLLPASSTVIRYWSSLATLVTSSFLPLPPPQQTSSRISNILVHNASINSTSIVRQVQLPSTFSWGSHRLFDPRSSRPPTIYTNRYHMPLVAVSGLSPVSVSAVNHCRGFHLPIQSNSVWVDR